MKDNAAAVPLAVIVVGLGAIWWSLPLTAAFQCTFLAIMLAAFATHMFKGGRGRNEGFAYMVGFWVFTVCIGLLGIMAVTMPPRNGVSAAHRQRSTSHVASSPHIVAPAMNVAPRVSQQSAVQNGPPPVSSSAAIAPVPPPISEEVNAPFAPKKVGMFDMFPIARTADSDAQRARLTKLLAEQNDRLPLTFNTSWTWNSVYMRGNVITYSVTLPYSRRQENAALLGESLREQFVDAECRSSYSYLRRGYGLRLVVRDNENFDVVTLDFAPADLAPCEQAFLKEYDR